MKRSARAGRSGGESTGRTEEEGEYHGGLGRGGGVRMGKTKREQERVREQAG